MSRPPSPKAAIRYPRLTCSTIHPMSATSLSAVIPAYRDEANLPILIHELTAVLTAYPLTAYEVIVVEDGSPDRTGTVADQLAHHYPNLRVIHHPTNQGYGATLADGFRAARYPYTFYTDGDCQFNLRELPRFIDAAHPRRVIAGWRIKKQYTPYRHLISHAFNTAVRRLHHLPHRDINCAFKLFPTALLHSFPITSRSGFIDAELLLQAKQQGYEIKQLPVTHRPRHSGRASGSNFNVITTTIQELVQYRPASPPFPRKPSDRGQIH